MKKNRIDYPISGLEAISTAKRRDTICMVIMVALQSRRIFGVIFSCHLFKASSGCQATHIERVKETEQKEKRH